MSNIVDPSYIDKTESYIAEHKDEMPKQVYDFIFQVCKDERKYLDLVDQWGKQKGVLKVPEPNPMKLPKPW